MTASRSITFPRHIYPLDPRTHNLSEEEVAVVFAMTSRLPDSFDVLRERVSADKAAQFHERWVLGYGHASVAEHAVLHLAVENVSRLAADTLEDNRLASYTEKSSRYQVLQSGYYHTPRELDTQPKLRRLYVETCKRLFATYEELVEGVKAYLRQKEPRKSDEKEGVYDLRLRRQAVDHCRFVLPAATLTNLGVTMNARALEHAITKLLSSSLIEEQEIGVELKTQGQVVTPTLVKYAERNGYLVRTWDAQRQRGVHPVSGTVPGGISAQLVQYDTDAEARLATALLYRFASRPYDDVWARVQAMDADERRAVIGACLEHLGPHDIPARELEFVSYTFDLVMDYGAYREFKRHRMQSYVAQPLTTKLGFLPPPLVEEAGLTRSFVEALQAADRAYAMLSQWDPDVAQYVVTHAHLRRVLARMDLRECYHIFKLRTSPEAHFSIRRAMARAFTLLEEAHPALVAYIWNVMRVDRADVQQAAVEE